MSSVAIEIDVDPEIEWWRPLVAVVLYIPHGVWTVILAVASAGAGLLTAVSVVVTGRKHVDPRAPASAPTLVCS